MAWTIVVSDENGKTVFEEDMPLIYADMYATAADIKGFYESVAWKTHAETRGVLSSIMANMISDPEKVKEAFDDDTDFDTFRGGFEGLYNRALVLIVKIAYFTAQCPEDEISIW